MSLVTKIRKGEGPLWGRLKRLVKLFLGFHLPVNAITLPFYRGLYRFHVSVRESWIWFRRFFWNEPLFRSQCESVGAGLRMEELPYIQGKGSIIIGDHVRLSGKSGITFGRPSPDLPRLVIGDHSFIGHACGFNIGRSITIGKHCLIATGVVFYDQDGHPIDAMQRRLSMPSCLQDISSISLGDDVWIGAGSVILKGVAIGDRSIVAARSVVTKSVPADTIVAGNPARPVGSTVCNSSR